MKENDDAQDERLCARQRFCGTRLTEGTGSGSSIWNELTLHNWQHNTQDTKKKKNAREEVRTRSVGAIRQQLGEPQLGTKAELLVPGVVNPKRQFVMSRRKLSPKVAPTRKFRNDLRSPV